MEEEFNIELSYYTTIKGKDRDDACDKARRELKENVDKVEVSYCERR